MFEWGALWGNPNLRLSSIGDIEITDVKGGFGFSAIIKNNGEEDTDVNWTIDFESDILILGKHKSGKIVIPAGGEVKIRSGLIFGFGDTKIATKVKDKAGISSSGFMFGPLLLSVN
jgi:hypothetical protein